MIRKLTYILAIASAFSGLSLKAQLTVNGAQLFIQAGAVITVQGDVTGTTDILGPGKILLQGSVNQNVDMGGFTIPVLEINNAAGATLTGNTRIGTSLTFTSGKIKTGNFDLALANVATFSGAGTSKFIETTGTGQVFKEVNANISSNEIPVGAGISYRPAFLTTLGTYNSTAKIGIRLLAVADPNRPPKLSDYINAYWPITKTGITGTVTVAGQYIDPADITSGAETNLRGYYFNGTDWSSSGETHNNATNQISAPITALSGNLTALDKFDLLKAKVFLQGAYNTSTGVMSDALRTPTNLIPLSDPYRTAPYNSSFTHVANAITEVAAGSVFSNQASTNDNIVDWIFLELRSTTVSPGNTVLQTRSALVQRDGEIVDIDGVSPVTFNNVASANYTIAVRHRNHLGLSSDPSTFKPLLGETKSTASLVDYTIQTDPNLYGPSTAYLVATDGKNVLWSGDINNNGFVRYQGSNGPTGPNDRVVLLQDLSNNETNVLNIYSRGDVNLNTFTRYQGSNGPPPAGLNDRLWILQQALGNSEITVRTQSLPN
ncbi:MAG TPA: hypothetical protein VGP55_04845 [Chitinophagaceae bacterium]|nr:hypothetical protein [Chitinophagaceae bacterium]